MGIRYVKDCIPFKFSDVHVFVHNLGISPETMSFKQLSSLFIIFSNNVQVKFSNSEYAPYITEK